MNEQCLRPRCSSVLGNRPVTHYIVMGSQRVPVCTVCANEAFKEDFALIGAPTVSDEQILAEAEYHWPEPDLEHSARRRSFIHGATWVRDR
jgi:hypothetical protein